MADTAARPIWWRELKGPDNRPLPSSVVERLTFYANQVRHQRVGNYVLEGTTIVVAASIPVAATLGAPVALMGVLGAVVTVLAGLRQLIRPGENWIRCSRTLVSLQREVVLWSVAASPYDGPGADAILVENAEGLVAQETAGWADQRTLGRASQQQVVKDPT